VTQDIIDALRKVAAEFQTKLGDNNLLTVAADEIESLRRERDEARREVCKCNSTSYPHDMKESHEIAESRGWDCFKEDGK
jgi:hypothetical protein